MRRVYRKSEEAGSRWAEFWRMKMCSSGERARGGKFLTSKASHNPRQTYLHFYLENLIQSSVLALRAFRAVLPKPFWPGWLPHPTHRVFQLPQHRPHIQHHWLTFALWYCPWCMSPVMERGHIPSLFPTVLSGLGQQLAQDCAYSRCSVDADWLWSVWAVSDQRGKRLPLEYNRKKAGDTGAASTEVQLHRWPCPRALTSSGTVLGTGSGVSGGQTGDRGELGQPGGAQSRDWASCLGSLPWKPPPLSRGPGFHLG